MNDDIPEFGDEVGLRRLVRRAIERVRAMDIPEADKRAWIACIEKQYRAANVPGELHSSCNVKRFPIIHS
jgi:hypothetical protein